MKYFFIILIILTTSCSKPKSVMICGNHVCVNKAEAEQYFEENLSIEVKIIDKNKKKELNLVELNLSETKLGKKKIIISKKNRTKKNIKILTNDEITKIKKDIKEKKEIAKKNNIKKKIKKKPEKKDIKFKSTEKISKTKLNKKKTLNIGNQYKKNVVVDVCTILEKCSIDEISKYLIKQGKKKNFPDITKRQ